MADDDAAGRSAQTATIAQALAHEGRLPAQIPGTASRGLAAPLWVFAVVALSAMLAWALLS
jgi:hypothetical protein